MWFNTAQDKDLPLLKTLSLAWPLCGLKSSLQSLKNSWGRLVASVQVGSLWPGHFDHRFSESKSLFHWSWHYQVVQTRVTVSTFLFQTTLTWTIIFHLLIKWLLIRGSNALISSKATCKRTQQLQTMLRLNGAKSLTGFKLYATTATTSNNVQQGVQTDAICNIQRCWDRSCWPTTFCVRTQEL